MSEGDLQLPKQVYRLRVLGLALGFLCVGSVFYDHGASGPAWLLLGLHAFVWPHAAWYRAQASADSHRAERQHLLVDSALGGVFVALMEFSLLPCVLLVTMLSMDKIGWGVRFLIRASALMAASCALTAVLTGAEVRPLTTMSMIVFSLPLMVAYPVAVALVSNRSGRLARERRKAVEEMVALREQLAHIARVGTLGEMAAGLAHELNQPLTAIHLEAVTALELAALNDVDAMRDGLSRISEQSLRAGDIVRRMRTFARRDGSSRQAIEMDELIHEVLALLDNELRLAGAETVLFLRPNAPRVLVDRVAIQQVLVNLMRNAMEAMARPSVMGRRLTIRTETVSGKIRVSVTDTGGGVDPAILDRLFHPFQSTKPAGLGLGLSICQTLIEAHGGRVGAGPHPDGGATFFFELPSVTETPA
jgi:C4-dicarboxylate-specific signal transduction histidine kinase